MVECGWKNSYNDKEIQIREDKDYEEKDGGHGMALSKKPVNGMKDILKAGDCSRVTAGPIDLI